MVSKKNHNISKTGHPASAQKINFDDVILPATDFIQNLSLDIQLLKLVIAGTTIKNISLNTDIKNGISSHSPFSATFINSSAQGHFALDFNASPPHVSAQLVSNSLDLGSMLEDFRFAEDVDWFVENITSNYQTSGQTIAELITNLEFSIISRSGSLSLVVPNTETVLPVNIFNSKISGSPGKKINLELQGSVADHNITIETSLDTVGALTEPKAIPFKQHLKTDKITWDMEGTIPIPYRHEGVSINSRFSADKISDFGTIFNVTLPKTGPFKLAGSLQISKNGYNLSNITAQLGSSSVNGDIILNTKIKPPELSIELQSDMIQLADFFTEVSISPPQPKNEKQVETQFSKQIDARMIPDTFNASLIVRTKKVFSGEDYLGNGLLKLSLDQGKLELAPLQISLPKGNINVDLSLKPFNSEYRCLLNINIAQLDYGIIGRWFKPESDLGGIFNLRSFLTSQSSDFKQLMPHASGYIDFSLQPEKLQTGVIDLWAVNLFSYLIPFFAPKNESEINCIAGSFDIDNGILSHEDLLVDTSKIQVKGTVEVDFSKRWIEARLRPIPKRPQFYSVATPIQVSGKLDSLDVAITTGGLMGTMIRLLTSYIVVPIQWIILDHVPKNGTEECLRILDKRGHLPGSYESTKAH